jgi:hypothetical protein
METCSRCPSRLTSFEIVKSETSNRDRSLSADSDKSISAVLYDGGFCPGPDGAIIKVAGFMSRAIRAPDTTRYRSLALFPFARKGKTRHRAANAAPFAPRRLHPRFFPCHLLIANFYS